MNAVSTMAHRNWSVRYYFCENERLAWRLANTFHEQLAAGRIAFPEWAGTKQRVLEIFFRQTATGVVIREARGSYYSFDPKGRLDHGPAVEGIAHLMQGTWSKQVGDNIIDIAPTLRHRRWLGDQFWAPSQGLLRAVKADLARPGHGIVGRVPVLKAAAKRRKLPARRGK